MIWGDGATSDPIIFEEPGNLSPLAHVYDDNGADGPYTVTVEVAEASPSEEETESPVGKATFSVNVANVSPNATFGAPEAVDEGGGDRSRTVRTQRPVVGRRSGPVSATPSTATTATATSRPARPRA